MTEAVGLSSRRLSRSPDSDLAIHCLQTARPSRSPGAPLRRSAWMLS
jgi:hypothetical protein